MNLFLHDASSLVEFGSNMSSLLIVLVNHIFYILETVLIKKNGETVNSGFQLCLVCEISCLVN